MIAPGLAITANHVLVDDFEALAAGEKAAFLVGVRKGSLDLWRLRSISYDNRGDIAYLSVELMSPLTPDWDFTSIALTTRCPLEGESVTIIGFRRATVALKQGGGVEALAQLLAARGTVRAVFHPYRNQILWPYPSIVIDCGSLGGMSGGAVLDDDGLLVGVVARGLQTEDRRGPTNAAWIVGGLNRSVTIPWPPGVYGSDPIHLMRIPHRALRIVGRDAVTVVNETRDAYSLWPDGARLRRPGDEI